MFRAVTSDVSAVSSFVADSTSPCNTLPPPCLKLRTSGFPCLQHAGPLRLQTGIQPRLSLATTGLSARSAFTNSSPTCTWPKLLAQARAFPQHCWFFRNQALRSSDTPFNLRFPVVLPQGFPISLSLVGEGRGEIMKPGFDLQVKMKLAKYPVVLLRA